MKDVPCECGDVATERNVKRQVQEVWSCRKCGRVLKEQKRESFTDRDAITLNDRTFLDGWLAKLRELGYEIAEQKESGFGKSWNINGASKWECQVHYEPSDNRRFGIRVTTKSSAASQKLRDSLEQLAVVCARHGVHATLSSTDTTPPGGKKETVTTYGASQTVAILVKVPTEIFKPIVQRLEAAMQEINTEFGLG